MAKSQIKSQKRITRYGEVFTAEHEVNAMLDMIGEDVYKADRIVLEPACGSGNFLVETLKRRLKRIKEYEPDIKQYYIRSIKAVSSLYGIDILDDNVQECQNRLLQLWKKIQNNI